MARVGIRQLKQNASAVIDRVRHGESVEVTDRGEPVALIVPLPKAGVLARLIAEGRARPAEGSLLDLPLPRPPKPGRPLPSTILETMRNEERW
jgi:prevent-host-death family protein